MMAGEEKGKRKSDLLLIAALLVLSGGTLLWQRQRAAAPDPTVLITVDGEEVYHGPASGMGKRLEIAGVHGGINVFAVETDEDGNVGIRCIEADCPDKICVNTGLVTLPDQPVVCLPHRVSARIE